MQHISRSLWWWTAQQLRRYVDLDIFCARVRAVLGSDAFPGPLVIDVNPRGDNLTRYRIPGRTLGEAIAFDPDALPLVETEWGPLPATRETVLAHELGHAVFKLRSEAAVIEEVENPVRDELGLPRRVRF